LLGGGRGRGRGEGIMRMVYCCQYFSICICYDRGLISPPLGAENKKDGWEGGRERHIERRIEG
jgi:hypothetical protein